MQEGRPKKDDSDVLVGAMEKLVQHSQCDSERKRRKTIIQKNPKAVQTMTVQRRLLQKSCGLYKCNLANLLGKVLT